MIKPARYKERWLISPRNTNIYLVPKNKIFEGYSVKLRISKREFKKLQRCWINLKTPKGLTAKFQFAELNRVKRKENK